MHIVVNRVDNRAFGGRLYFKCEIFSHEGIPVQIKTEGRATRPSDAIMNALKALEEAVVEAKEVASAYLDELK